MVWQSVASLVDGWPERGAVVSAATAGRVAWWLLRRRKGAAPPLFGWVGRHLALEWTNITLSIELRTANARLRKLEAGIRQAGLEHLLGSPDSSAPSSGSAGATPTASSSGATGPSPTTSP